MRQVHVVLGGEGRLGPTIVCGVFTSVARAEAYKTKMEAKLPRCVFHIQHNTLNEGFSHGPYGDWDDEG